MQKCWNVLRFGNVGEVAGDDWMALSEHVAGATEKEAQKSEGKD